MFAKVTNAPLHVGKQALYLGAQVNEHSAVTLRRCLIPHARHGNGTALKPAGPEVGHQLRAIAVAKRPTWFGGCPSFGV